MTSDILDRPAVSTTSPGRLGSHGRDPRGEMAQRLPAAVQPFLTWLTAKPMAGEGYRKVSGQRHLASAILWTLAGSAVGAGAFAGPWYALAALPLGFLLTSCGLGLFQVVIFHHCAHGTVFKEREHNRLAGRLISALLLFKHFDVYQREHMLHHSAKRLFTHEDEFTQFVFDMCGLEAGLDRRELWRRVAAKLASPSFHAHFLLRRIQASLLSHDRTHNCWGASAWIAAIGVAAACGQLVPFIVVWLVPVTVLLQVATVFRILCEHRFPDRTLIEARDKTFVGLATAGVFPGAMPPPRQLAARERAIGWIRWWATMLAIHLPVRLFVLVGDAPCHDYHHRRPASKRWPNYIHARQADQDAGCPGFPVNYIETWGLFRAIDQNLASLAATAPEALGSLSRPSAARDGSLRRQADDHRRSGLGLAANAEAAAMTLDQGLAYR